MIPKLLLASAAVAVILGSCAGGENDSVKVAVAEPELLASPYGDGEPMWVGTIERRSLEYDAGNEEAKSLEEELSRESAS